MARNTARGPRAFAFSQKQVVVTSIVVLLFGAFLEIVGTFSSNAIALSFAATLLPLALVTLVTEFILRASYTQDLLELVNLSTHIRDVGIEQVTTDDAMDWPSFYADSSSVRVLLLRPQAWSERDWNAVLTSARKRRVAVDVFFPDPDSWVGEAVARHLETDASLYTESVRSTAKYLETSWKAAKTDATNPLDSQSTISIEYVAKMPSYSIIQTDNHGVIIFQPPVANAANIQQLVIGFTVREPTMPRQWFASRWNDIRLSVDSAPQYTDRQPS